MKSILLFVGLLLFFSCSDNHEIDEGNIIENNLQSRAGGDGGYDLLGYGYDVTGEFYNPNSAKSPVIDIQRFYQFNAGRVITNTSSTSYGELCIGKTAKDYLSKLTISMDAKYKGIFWGGSLNASYASNNSYSAKYSFASYNLYIQHKQVFMNASVELLQQYLTPEFVSDLQQQSPEYIIKNYGTHILTNISLGARLQIIYRSFIKEENKETIVKAGASARILKVFKLNISGDYETNEVNKNSEEMISYKTIGGDPSKSLIDRINVSSNTSTEINIANWQESSNTSNMAFIYSSPNTMIPIYDLVADPVKKASLQAAVNRYINEHTFEDVYERVPLYRYVTYGKNLDLNHFYTTDWNELGAGPGNTKWKYKYEGIECYVYPVWCKPEGSVPLYRYGSIAKDLDHFYCTDWNELGYGPGNNRIKYKLESIECYVCPVTNKPANAVPLYRYGTYGKDLDHFYTIVWNEIGDGKADGYTFESIECYVFRTERD